MNFDKLFASIAGIVIAFAACGQLETLQRWVWQAQARVVYESRTSTWGSPRFFKPQLPIPNHEKRKESQIHSPSSKTQNQKTGGAL